MSVTLRAVAERERFTTMDVARALRYRAAALMSHAARRLKPPPLLAPLPFDGFTDGRIPTRNVDLLTDDQLQELNGLLPWHTYTVDRRGRRFGNRMAEGKKELPQVPPDYRVVMTDEVFHLADKHVLEVGCLEGINTIGLAQRARSVTAVDISLSYAVKTIVRSAFFGVRPEVFVCDVEKWQDDDALRADVLFHVGVLYHLADPVRHLLRMGRLTTCGMLLDTHIAEEHEATESMTVDEVTYSFKRMPERPGYASEVHSKWLPLDELVELLGRAGFDPVEVVERREERHGPRVAIVAHKADA